jgi:alkyl hydroperoxide reductase subunit AhpC
MSIRLGDNAPNFTAKTTEGEIDFHKWMDGKWAMLFSYPEDFTPVCTTELGAVAKLLPEFEKRNTKVIGLSVDSVSVHNEWNKDIDETQCTTMNYPVIGDEDSHVSDLYDLIHPNSSGKQTIRAVYIVGPDKKIKLSMAYPSSTGRNFKEILRSIDSLQIAEKYEVATPADWNAGEDMVVKPSVPDSELEAKFPQGVTKIKSYLRTTPSPVK